MQPWWKGRPLRIFHPNPAESEVEAMDAEGFIDDCVQSNAEAVVVSTGGIYAFYPSDVEYHYVSPVIGDRDLIREITSAAQDAGLHIIARVDFSKAREDVYADHPEWFIRRPDGGPGRQHGYYLTCPVAGYQNEGFAHRVLEEILTRYPVAGFHLNAGGFHGICTCEACMSSFGQPIPVSPEVDPELWLHYLRWRRQALAEQIEGFYEVMQAIQPDVFFMGELAGQEYSDWARNNGAHYPSLDDAFSQILVSSGGMRYARTSRWWVGMSAERVRAAGSRCLINIKIHMRDLNINQTVMPPAEFAFLGYQAIAHSAGLKLPTFGIPATMADPRAMPAISDLLGFMQRQQPVLDTMTPVHQVGLVWPDQALLRADFPDVVDADALEADYAGLYTALTALHVPFRVVYDELLAEEALDDLDVLVLPTPAYLTEAQADALVAMAERGGRVVLLDSPAVKDAPNLSAPLAEHLPLASRSEMVEVGYAVAAAAAPSELRRSGPVPLLRPFRKVAPPSDDADVWLWAAYCGQMGVPEDAESLAPSEDPVIVRVNVGGGDIVYATTSFGQAVMDFGHVDMVALLRTLIFHDHDVALAVETDAPTCIDVAVARWEKGLVVHLVNACGPAPLDVPVPVGPITLDVAWSGPAICTWVQPGREALALDVERGDREEDGGRLTVTVPQVNFYGQLVLTSS